MKFLFYLVVCSIFSLIHFLATGQPGPQHHLKFDSLATRWDEGIPLGNGWLGALIWKKENKLRISLDRVDLWDDRPMPEIDKLRFNWVIEQVKKNQYDTVQRLGDHPYEKYPAPTKIPGAALEFDLATLGEVQSNVLDIKTGLSTIRFKNGIVMNNYIHATHQIGYFGFEHLPAGSFNRMNKTGIPELIIPPYVSTITGNSANSVEGQSLERLGYKKGELTYTVNSIRYHQPTYNKEYYEVLVKWQRLPGNQIIGQWTINQNAKAELPDLDLTLPEPTFWPGHLAWWNDYWGRSSLSLPDAIIEKQYYLDMYKFGCVARSNTPPISLQAIWTADNGKLPPWKGDYHHDLNTQLSYWPGYTGNHLDLTMGYTNWLWKVKGENIKWTKQYFETDGLNVPGVTTISGKPMGGWIQYSMSPTISAWLAQHFYWQWKYGMDPEFLKSKAYPYISEVSRFTAYWLDRQWNRPEDIISSSPEYFDNSVKAWFRNFTNYDLSLMRHQINIQLELQSLNNSGDKKFKVDPELAQRIPAFQSNETGLMVATGQNLEESHRHHSPYMAIYPLGLLKADNPDDLDLINRSLAWIEKKGSRKWTGYSFSWMAALYARAKKGDQAKVELQKFATNFCSINSFHLNGDQKGGQYSDFTYRPFTLEGNFAFAQALHEMLIQSYQGFIEVFPAIPDDWKTISFQTLRTEGAFLVSAKKDNGNIDQVVITSEGGGKLRFKLPFKTWYTESIDRQTIKTENGIAEMQTSKGQTIVFKNGYE